MKMFTMQVDDKVDALLEELRVAFGKKSKAAVFRMAIALLNEAKKAKDEGKRLVISSRDAKSILKELVIVT
ncbi:MAG: hypothetical protein Q7R85_01985 [bacterium]|nr:hypothetical protein [bacterium]